MGWLGKSIPGLSFLIAGASHDLIEPMKMPARTGPEIFSGARAFVLTLTMTATPPRAHGIWKQPLQPANWSGVSGASEAPKSTVRPEMAAMPAPEPDGE